MGMQFLCKCAILFALLSFVASESNVVTIGAGNFTRLTFADYWLLNFYAPWCGFSKALAPVYEEVATMVVGECNVAKIDATVETDLMHKFGVRGYPTIFFYWKGKVSEYPAGRPRDIPNLLSFISDNIQNLQNLKPLEEPSYDFVTKLNVYNVFDYTSSGSWFVEFSANNDVCKTCKFARQLNYYGIRTALVMVQPHQIAFCQQSYNVTTYPTIYYIDGAQKYLYTRPVDVENMLNFNIETMQFSESSSQENNPDGEPSSGLEFGLTPVVFMMIIVVAIAVLISIKLKRPTSPAPVLVHYEPLLPSPSAPA